MKKNQLKGLILILFAAAVTSFFYFDLGNYLSFDFLKSQQQAFADYYQQNQILTLVLFFTIYVAVTAFSLPGAAVLTLAAGFLFDLGIGTLLVSFASSIGATLAFLMARFILKEGVQKKFGDKLKTINEGIEKEGSFYLVTLRLLPVFPFFVINIVMGLTPIKTATFYIVSQLAMLPGTVVYVNAGTQLSKIDSLKGILSPSLLLSFVILGTFPIIAKKVIALIKGRKNEKPKKFDYNITAIGGGSAGLVTSYIAAAIKAKVALIEKHKMGGDCLNTGCVPSKAIIRTGKILSLIKRHKEFGLSSASAEFNFADVMERIQNVVAKIEPHDSVERYTNLGVDCITEEAKIISPWEVQVGNKTITTKSLVIATGARPFVPPIPGIDKVNILTSDNIWDIREQPKRLIVLGGGPIGAELAQSFARLGSQVTIVDRAERLMPREDNDVSDVIMEKFRKEDINLLTGHDIKSFTVEGDQKYLITSHNGQEVKTAFDQVLCALGRAPNTKGFGLEELGIELTDRGTIAVDDFLATKKYKHIFGCGDVVGPYQFTHMAAHQAYYACVNGLFYPYTRFIPPPFNKSFKVDYSVVPWATYTDPEVSTVGHTEKSAQAAGIEYEVSHYGIDDLDRAIADSDDNGFVKVLTPPKSDKILGATIVHSRSSDLILEFIAGMKHSFGLNSILGTIHIYPTMGEANKFLAGNWKRAHSPQGALQLLGKFHNWRRS